MGCKRVLFTSDWYSTLTRGNVELIHGEIERITANGVVGSDGVEREADAIIWGTGFSRTTSSPRWRSTGSTATS